MVQKLLEEKSNQIATIGQTIVYGTQEILGSIESDPNKDRSKRSDANFIDFIKGILGTLWEYLKNKKPREVQQEIFK